MFRLRLSSPTETGRLVLGNRFAAWRRLAVSEVDAILCHFMALDREQRAVRFRGAVTEEVLRRRYRSLDYEHAEIVGCETPTGIVALLEVYPDAHGASVEVVMSMRNGLLGAGLCHTLLALAIAHARRGGADRIEVEFPADDAAMRRIVMRHGFALRQASDVVIGWRSPEPDDAAPRAA